MGQEPVSAVRVPGDNRRQARERRRKEATAIRMSHGSEVEKVSGWHQERKRTARRWQVTQGATVRVSSMFHCSIKNQTAGFGLVSHLSRPAASSSARGIGMGFRFRSGSGSNRFDDCGCDTKLYGRSDKAYGRSGPNDRIDDSRTRRNTGGLHRHVVWVRHTRGKHELA